MPGCDLLRSAVLGSGRCLAFCFACLASSAEADSFLPQYPLNTPEGYLSADESDRQSADILPALDLWGAMLDPPSTGWLQPARTRLAVMLDASEARVRTDQGAASRAMAQLLASTLDLRNAASGQAAAFDAARNAVAIERQLSANAVFFAGFFPGTQAAADSGLSTDAAEQVLMFLQDEASFEREELGLPAPRPAERLALELVQAVFVGETAMAAARPIRQNPAIYPDAAMHRKVFDTKDLMAELSDLQRLVDGGFVFPDPDATLASSEAAYALAEENLNGLIAANTDIADVLFPGIMTLTDLQRYLRDDEALVILYPNGVHVLLFAVSRDGFALRRSGADWVSISDASDRLRAALGQTAGRAATAIDAPLDRPTKREAFRQEAHYLYQNLLQPLEDVIADKPRLLLAVTARSGMDFPIELLLTEPAAPDAEDAALPWLVRKHSVQVIPSVDLIWLRANDKPTPAESFYAGFGDPDYHLPSALGRSNWATRILDDLRPLPDSAGEVRMVAEAFGPANGMAVVGADATEYLLSETSKAGTLKQFTVLHFATHGLVFGDHPDVGEPFLALTPALDLAGLPSFEVGHLNDPNPDGALTAGEIRQLDLGARLVILSACSSGKTDGDARGVTSLGAAFLAAGAERVLATHWPVNSAAAVEIVTAMARHDPAMADPAQGLQAALLETIAKGGRHADPAWWAAFSLIGRP